MGSSRNFAWVVCCIAFLSTSAYADDGKRTCSLTRHGDDLFEPRHWPAASLDDFAAGKLGVIKPSYDHFYLVIAYRKLAGLAITKQNIERLRDRDPCWLDESTSYYYGYEPTRAKAFRSAVDSWLSSRSSVAPVETSTNGVRTSEIGYEQFKGCNADSFRTAAQTLNQRRMRHGDNDHLKAWIKGQDVVFLACSGTKVLPDLVPASAPRWLWLDRQYQFAAAYFYQGEYGNAIKKFDAIAATPDSPWRSTAPYLAARALIRSATSKQEYGESLDLSILADAEARLKSLLMQKVDGQFRDDASRLLQFVQLRTNPQTALRAIDTRLRAKKLTESAGQDLTDFWYAFQASLNSPPVGDLSAWIAVLRSTTADDAVANWKRTNKVPWLVAALSSASPDLAQVGVLIAAAQKVPKSSPAYLTARYHLIRLVGRSEEAVQLADDVLSDKTLDLNYQEANSIRSVAFSRAKSLAEFARFAPREASEDMKRYAPAIDTDAAPIVNAGLPLDSMVKLLADDQLPQRFRSELALVVWTRAFVLQRWDISRQLAPTIKGFVPHSTNLVDSLLEARSVRDRMAIGAILLARYPGIVGNMDKTTSYSNFTEPYLESFSRPNMRRDFDQDGERENWWCVMETEFQGSSWDITKAEGGNSGVESAFVDEREFDVLKSERQLLNDIPNATDYLGKIIMDWAMDHPRDPRLPQALYMLIKSTRGGCVDGSTGLSKAAFRHLHRYFPDDILTKKTRVHY